MSGNARSILGDVVEQMRQESMPEVSLQDYFEIFSAEQVTKNFGLTFEELENGIVDGEHDGGIDSVFVFVNGDLIHEDTDLSRYKKNVIVNLTIIQSKTSNGFSEDPINRLIASLPTLLSLTTDYSALTQYSAQVKSALDVFRNAYRALAARFPALEISVFYSALGAESEIHANLMTKSAQLKAIITQLFDDAKGLCCTNPVRDSSRESSVIAGGHEQTEHSDLQDPELAILQRGAQAPGIADDLVRSGHVVGGAADRQAWATARLQ